MAYGSARLQRWTVWGLAAAVLTGGCDVVLTAAPDPGDLLDAPLAGLSPVEAAAFALGDERFEERFAPSMGLGPIFNNVSCASCHGGDGRGRPQPEFSNIVQRLDGAHAVVLGEASATLERRAIPGAEPETAPPGAALSQRLPPPVFGLGLIEAIPEAAIVANADPDDANGDGISGRPHWVTPAPWVPPTEVGAGPGARLGRFTRKARVSSILEQVADAYHKDMGITSDFLAVENDNRRATVPTHVADRIVDPEIPAEVVQQVVFYIRTLAPPAPGPMNARRREGEQRFHEIGCASCHVPELHTGAHAIAALANQPVGLYSDLLLHDMGDALADGVGDGDASPHEWRTAPLWGLRVMRDFLDGEAFLLHDGRARSVEDAILLHGGEAASARDRFSALAPDARAALLDFVESR
jgi:CxxC motif-containing protein (DUF1111 family)